ncbi:MAG: D-tyrosyl-tRNA(Tyr) deacylase, partial [Deltaproteobacteria bacterium]|nr:D-tyrosyl-tRNA(Tyr) deacylase [Deltaproteobacteria bacterium]
MRAVLQRVSEARVVVDGETVGETGPGLLVLLGVGGGDTEADAEFLADKTANLRIFEDDAGRMNLSVADVSGSVLVVSQFTLLADCGKGRRPSFAKAADPDLAVSLYETFIQNLRARGLPVQTGSFGAMMDVSLTNHGPV